MMKKLKKILLVVLCFAFVIPTLAGCGKKDDTFTIGFCGALTGGSAQAGITIENTLKYAAEEINKQGGIDGKKVRVVIRDDESDATKNLVGVKELLYKESVDLMFGSVNSGSCSASLEVICDAKVPEFLTEATATSLVDPVKYPYIFRNHPTNALQAEKLVAKAKEGNYNKIVAIGDTTDLGKDAFSVIKELETKYGITVAEYIPYMANDSDLTAVAQSIQNSGADCVISFAYFTDLAKILKALDRLSYLDDVMILSYSAPLNMKFTQMVLGLDLSNIICCDAASGFCIVPGEEKMTDKYQQMYDLVEGLYGEYKLDGSGRTVTVRRFIRTIDCIYFVKWLIEEKIHSFDGEDIKNAIETYSSEYQPIWTEHSYIFSATNHEGLSLDDVIFCTTDAPLVNDYVKGDIPWKYVEK